MNTQSGTSRSLWMDSTPIISSDGPLMSDITTEICIIGAGIAGLTTAYLLVKEGKKVVVLDRDEIGSGMTGRTTAHLVSAIDDRFYRLEQLFGTKAAFLAGQSHRAAIDTIKKIIDEEEIDCEFERLDGYLFTPPAGSFKELEKEYAAALRAGSDVTLVERAPIEHLDTRPALCFANQAQFNPIKYLAGLSNALWSYNCKIFTNTNVTDLIDEQETFVKTSRGYIVKASKIVVATNSPINNNVKIPLKQAGYMTYVIGARIPRNSVHKALFWDTLKNYHYVRIAESAKNMGGDQILIIGGEDHKVGQENDGRQRHQALEEWGRKYFPMMKECIYRWSGEVMEPIDSLAFIGKNSPDNTNIYIVTGDSGNGMTHGTIAGILITDLILDRHNEWIDIYDPSRHSNASFLAMTKETFNTSVQYFDWISPGEVNSVDDILPNEGAIVQRGLKKVAIYRDEKTEIHEYSAVCPHLAGIVHWNSTEKTWDCPCHGSRFDAKGQVIHGPANQNLTPVNQSVKQKESQL